MGTSQNHTQKMAAHVSGRETGFTLLEVLVAISVLTVGILAIASMQISSTHGNAFAGRVTEATTWAGDRLETLMSLPYDDDDLSAGNHTDPDPPSGYGVTWTVADNAVFNNTKTITVTVTWSKYGIQKSVSITHVRAR
ncbi:MAG: prepilin-type N-terminal cleavage/methylation domain-containing protein [Deltaproteobacteria bacterium]|nr:prepilin-type N-terminal cleavage/methylation domain-containing protein [Deltaproteobacteria bacterium]